MKQIFDRYRVGTRFFEHGRKPPVDLQQLLREGRLSGNSNRAAQHQLMPRAVGIDAAVPRTFGPGVDAEDPHASDASISFSSISKFDQTCRTSSCSSSASMSLT